MTGFRARHGIVPNLRWGFVALTLFMVGGGIEAGFGAGQVSLLWGVYGFVVAVAAWLSGALAEAFGPRRVMLAGFGARGLGYPLFAYGFLVWVALDTPEAVMGKAVGWYWFFSVLGLGVLGSYYAGLAIPLIGEFATLASSLAFIGAGGLILVLGVRARRRERTPDHPHRARRGTVHCGMADRVGHDAAGRRPGQPGVRLRRRPRGPGADRGVVRRPGPRGHRARVLLRGGVAGPQVWPPG